MTPRHTHTPSGREKATRLSHLTFFTLITNHTHWWGGNLNQTKLEWFYSFIWSISLTHSLVNKKVTKRRAKLVATGAGFREIFGPHFLLWGNILNGTLPKTSKVWRGLFNLMRSFYPHLSLQSVWVGGGLNSGILSWHGAVISYNSPFWYANGC